MKENLNLEKSYYHFIFNPVIISSFVVMVINDHLIRRTNAPDIIKGKLSDIAILIFLPAVGALIICYSKYCISLFEGWKTKGRKKLDYHLTYPAIYISILFTGIIFTLINSSTTFNIYYTNFINSINILKSVFPILQSTRDTTDLFTLPSLILSYFILKRYAK